MPPFLRRLRARLRYRRFEQDLAEEIAFHRAMKERELERDGIGPHQARLLAHRELGNITSAREQSRGIWIASWIESVWQDISYAVRSLRRQPGFALAAIVTLVLGLGLNTSAFTFFNSVALSTWAVDDPSRVVWIRQLGPPRRGAPGVSTAGFALAEYRYLRDHTKTFSGMIAWRSNGGRLGHEEIGRFTYFEHVSGNYFDVLGVQMALGRGFRPDEDRPETPQAVAVISHQLWTRQFNSDPATLGKPVRVDEIPYTIVGVAAPEFMGTDVERQALWLPFPAIKFAKKSEQAWADELLTSPTFCCSYVAGRLAPGVSREQARAELDLLVKQFRTQAKGPFPYHALILSSTSWIAEPGMQHVLIPMFSLLFAAVALVLLLACANVGNLMLARGLARQREIAIRLSLGASRARVVRQLLTEALIIALLAGGIALAVAYVLPAVLFDFAFTLELGSPVRPDASVLAFSFGVSLAACVLSGLLPAFRSTRAVGAQTGRHLRTRSGARLRSVLLSAQLALGVVLLLAAALMVRGVQHARFQDPSFRIEDVSAATFLFPAQVYDNDRAKAFFAELLPALRSDEELRDVALTQIIPLTSTKSWFDFRFPGEDKSLGKTVQLQDVSTSYLDVLGIPIVAGRGFRPDDRGRRSIVINETFARRYFQGSNPIGRLLDEGQYEKEIIGVAKDAHTSGFDTINPTVYSLIEGRVGTKLLLRTPSSASGLSTAAAARLKAIVQRVDSRVLVETKPLAIYRDRWLAPARVAAFCAGAIGVLALVLACVGVFGVFAYVVQERTREIGIRMAIGAQAGQVVRLVLGATAWSTLSGLAIGAIASGLVSRFLEGWLYGVDRFDLRAYAGVALILAIAALIATYVPVRRATGVDPATALRSE